MGRFATRSAFAAALCAGVAMVGTSIHGLVSVDAELQRSVLAAQERTNEGRSFRVTWREQERDCPAPVSEPRSSQKV